jgi:hypothetical protein
LLVKISASAKLTSLVPPKIRFIRLKSFVALNREEAEVVDKELVEKYQQMTLSKVRHH